MGCLQAMGRRGTGGGAYFLTFTASRWGGFKLGMLFLISMQPAPIKTAHSRTGYHCLREGLEWRLGAVPGLSSSFGCILLVDCAIEQCTRALYCRLQRPKCWCCFKYCGPFVKVLWHYVLLAAYTITIRQYYLCKYLHTWAYWYMNLPICFN